MELSLRLMFTRYRLNSTDEILRDGSGTQLLSVSDHQFLYVPESEADPSDILDDPWPTTFGLHYRKRKMGTPIHEETNEIIYSPTSTNSIFDLLISDPNDGYLTST